jgi:hypothetical protein
LDLSGEVAMLAYTSYLSTVLVHWKPRLEQLAGLIQITITVSLIEIQSSSLILVVAAKERNLLVD